MQLGLRLYALRLFIFLIAVNSTFAEALPGKVYQPEEFAEFYRNLPTVEPSVTAHFGYPTPYLGQEELSKIVKENLIFSKTGSLHLVKFSNHGVFQELVRQLHNPRIRQRIHTAVFVEGYNPAVHSWLLKEFDHIVSVNNPFNAESSMGTTLLELASVKNQREPFKASVNVYEGGESVLHEIYSFASRASFRLGKSSKKIDVNLFIGLQADAVRGKSSFLAATMLAKDHDLFSKMCEEKLDIHWFNTNKLGEENTALDPLSARNIFEPRFERLQEGRINQLREGMIVMEAGEKLYFELQDSSLTINIALPDDVANDPAQYESILLNIASSKSNSTIEISEQSPVFDEQKQSQVISFSVDLAGILERNFSSYFPEKFEFSYIRTGLRNGVPSSTSYSSNLAFVDRDAKMENATARLKLYRLSAQYESIQRQIRQLEGLGAKGFSAFLNEDRLFLRNRNISSVKSLEKYFELANKELLIALRESQEELKLKNNSARGPQTGECRESFL